MNAAKPIHLLSGGPGSRSRAADPLLAPILAQAGTARPTIAYVGAASDDDRDFLGWIASYLKKAGAGDVRLAPLASPSADLAQARAVLSGSDLVFVSGGDVEAGMAILDEQGVVPFLKGLYAGGKPFFGASAGAILLARAWVRWRDPDDEATAERFPCLGLADVLCDTHAEADGWEELRALLALGRPATGHGIPTGAALRVTAGGRVAALGRPVPRFARRDGKVVRLPDLLP